MPITEDQYRDALRLGFSAFTTSQRRASLVLGGKLAILQREARVAHIPAETADQIAREEMEKAMRRLTTDAATFHPAVPLLSEGAE